MLKAADILERDKEKFAHLMTLEMGKPYKAAVAEAVKCTTACRYYAENAEKILTDEVIDTGAKKSFVRYRPIAPSSPLCLELPFLASHPLRRSRAHGRNVGCSSTPPTFPSAPRD